ncbi:MAG: hypothetical protein J1F06_01925, partial [Prevotellaceae bacterium]|nr:hypothetical protein [Prevotellaceae bacterium]
RLLRGGVSAEMKGRRRAGLSGKPDRHVAARALGTGAAEGGGHFFSCAGGTAARGVYGGAHAKSGRRTRHCAIFSLSLQRQAAQGHRR